MPEDQKKEVMVGGIKATNEFKRPKRERKKKTDVERIEEIRAELNREVPPVSKHPVSQQEAELDLQQMGEDTAHSPLAQPQPKSERPMTLVLKDKNTYYGTREIWERLFAAFHMTRGKIRVKNIGISEDSDGVHAELDIEPVPEDKHAT